MRRNRLTRVSRVRTVCTVCIQCIRQRSLPTQEEPRPPSKPFLNFQRFLLLLAAAVNAPAFFSYLAGHPQGRSYAWRVLRSSGLSLLPPLEVGAPACAATLSGKCSRQFLAVCMSRTRTPSRKATSGARKPHPLPRPRSHFYPAPLRLTLRCLVAGNISELFLDSFCLLCYCNKWVNLHSERDSPAVAFLFPGVFPSPANNRRCAF